MRLYQYNANRHCSTLHSTDLIAFFVKAWSMSVAACVWACIKWKGIYIYIYDRSVVPSAHRLEGNQQRLTSFMEGES